MEPKPNRFASKKTAIFSGAVCCISSVFLIVIDYTAIVFAVFLDSQLCCEFLLIGNDRTPMLMLNLLYVYGVVPCMFIISIAYANLYTRRIPLWQCIGTLFKICFCVNLLSYILSCFFIHTEDGRGLFLPLFWMLSFINLCMVRCLANLKRAL